MDKENADFDKCMEQINKKFGTSFNTPIFYFTELIGLAFGIEAKQLGVGRNLTGVNEFLKERELV